MNRQFGYDCFKDGKVWRYWNAGYTSWYMFTIDRDNAVPLSERIERGWPVQEG